MTEKTTKPDHTMHIHTLRKTEKSAAEKIRIAQATSTNARQIPVTLQPAPWEEENHG